MTSTVRSADGRVVVPEKLRRRRLEVRRGQGRRRLHRVVSFGILAVVLALGWVALRSPLLAVDQVTVTGSSHVTPAAIAAVSGIRPGVPMMDVSPGRAARRISSLPWVANATVSRQWPDRIRVTVTDRTPVAQVRTGSSYALVDRSGRVLQTGSARLVALPLITDRAAVRAGARIRSAGPLLATAAALPAAIRLRLGGLSLARDGSVALTLRDDGVVSLGRSDELETKFASAVAVLDHLGPLRKGCTLDVSVPMSPTVTPEYGCV